MSELRALRHLVANSSLREKVGDRLPDEFAEVLGESLAWSSGEKILLEVAYNLWSGRELLASDRLNLRSDVIDRLDDANYRAVIEAILTLRPLSPPKWNGVDRSILETFWVDRKHE